jgi:CRP-like cAMP-binding protein
MLKRAATLRKMWLVTDALKKLHHQAVLKTTFEAFEAALGSDIGKQLWRYAKIVEFEAGSFVCKEGEKNHTLYVLQHGRVSSYATQADDSVKRLHTMTRGAFMNDECLFLDLPVAHSAVAEESSVHQQIHYIFSVAKYLH